jgi:pseudomonalisin
MKAFFCCAFVFVCLAFPTAFAATQPGPAVQADRVAVHPDVRATTTLRGHVPGWAVSANDRGAVSGDTSLHLTFVLSRSPELQASFTQLLADQQNPNSPSYHQWLTPQQVGERYGPTQHDLDALTSWLATQGLTVVETTPSRVFVNVVAPASAVARALATSFHTFNDNGESRMSATVDPSIPAAFAAIVTTISGLADTDIRPMHHVVAMPASMPTQGSAGAAGDEPLYTSANGPHFLMPGDFSTIFDLKPVYTAGFTGVGQKVAIIGRSRVLTSDITDFESKAALATTNLPNTIIPTSGVDPGIATNGDAGEATLDVERVIGTAPGVQADLVVSSINSGGIFTAAQYEVQTLLDPVMTISFGSCEVNAGPSQVSLWDTLFSQAASEGISVFVSSGDSGAATCEAAGSVPQNYQFRSINYICSSSYATCVGGTELVEGANPSQYWSTTNGSGLTSALGYIPEGVWNEPTSTVAGTPFVVLGAGGGASLYVPKPAWQSGVGVPADSARDVPDVSFPSAGHDGYVTCYSQTVNCASGFSIFYGTSAAAPAMAAVTALLNQKVGGSQGNLNPLLYRVAASTPTAFHDATPASSGVFGCSVSTASVCNNSTPASFSPTGGLAGFALTTGYDQATGLGSLDVANFLNAAAAGPKTALASTTLAVQETFSFISNTQTNTFTAVLSSKAAGTPTGTVQFYANGNAIGSAVAVASGRAVTGALPFPAAGNYDISAVYSGDSTFASATAPGIALTVSGLSSQTKATIANANVPLGTTQVVSFTVSPISGSVMPTGVVRFTVTNGSSVSQLTVPLSNGVATSPVPFSTVGSATITASYQGDAVYSPSNSPTLFVTVQKLSSAMQLSSLAGTDAIGTGGGRVYSAVISSVVSGSTAAAPTGIAQLYSNGVAVGAPVVIAANLSAGQPVQVTFPFVSFANAGTYNITATYTGDSNWQPSTANSVSLTVSSTPASYQPVVSSPSLSMAAGGSTSIFVSISGALGYGGAVTLSCTVAYNGTGTANSIPTCSPPSSTLSVNPNFAPPSTVLTIESVASRDRRGSGGGVASGSGRHLPQGMAVCALLLCLVPVRRRGWRSIVMLLVFAAGFNLLSGCSGGGSGGGSSAPPPVLGTTAGSYTIKLAASANSPGVATPAPVTVALTIN